MLATSRHFARVRLQAATWVGRLAALDFRGLAVLRIGFGAILLWDLAVRATSLEAHYTDPGLLPRAVRKSLTWDYNEPWWMSLHMLSGEAWWQAGLFLLAAMAAVLLLAGYHTRWMTAASWLLLLSLHGRNPLLLQGGDVLLRCLLFWSIFVPLGACWSVDALRARKDRTLPRALGSVQSIASLGTLAIVVQLACMYLFSALLKTSPAWRSDFSAVYYALSVDHYTRPLGYAILEYPRLLQGLTAGSLLLEMAGPLLLLSPLGRHWMRTLVPLAFVAFHLGLAATMTLGTFPWICILAWIAILPTEFWNLLARRRTPRDAGQPPALASDLSGSFGTNLLIAALLVFVVLLNVRRLADPTATVGGGPLTNLGKAAGLAQYWNMFAPGPCEHGGWLRIEGETAAGELVNLYRPDQPLPDIKPTCVSATYPTQHWRRCLVTLWEYTDPPYRESVLRYFVDRWNNAQPFERRVVRGRLVQVVTPTEISGSRRLSPAQLRVTLCEWPASP